ncbi:MAG: SNF2-related protein [Bacteroidia bacterium]|nr:SNF2-related protein [Bacteroidia bacterium]
MAHQIAFIKTFGTSDSPALFCEMGTGKTKMCIDWIRMSFFTAGLQPVLIVCPLIAMHNWRDEFFKHSNIGPYVQVLDGYSKEKNIQYLSRSGKAIWVINYDKVPSLFDQLVKIPWLIIALDESHRIKNGKSVRTKDLIRLAPYSRKRAILTGTPILNSELDLFWQLYFLDFGKTFGTNFFSFRNRWFRDINAYKKHLEPGVYFPKFVIFKEFREDFLKKIRSVAFIKTTEECLDLPPKVYSTIKLDMDPEQRKVYNKLKDKYVVMLNEGTLVASTAAILQMRLSQVSSGFCQLDTGKATRFKTNPKIQAIKDLMEDIPEGDKIIVWAVFRDNIFQLMEEMTAFNPACIFGDTADKRVEEAKFKKDPTCRMIIINPQSGSEAINLVEACGAVYFSQGHSLGHRLQSEARCCRIGSEFRKMVWYTDLQYRNSVDPVISAALLSKKSVADALMNPDNFKEENDGDN